MTIRAFLRGIKAGSKAFLMTLVRPDSTTTTTPAAAPTEDKVKVRLNNITGANAGGSHDFSLSTTKKCPYCAEEIHSDAIKCKHCGEFLTPAVRREHRASPLVEFFRSRFAADDRARALVLFACGVGGLAGALIGFLLRPTAPLVGQLPFGIVITRGFELKGMDKILIPLAETSFNYVAAGLISGGIAGFVVVKLLGKRP